jgi:hypothetical protein
MTGNGEDSGEPSRDEDDFEKQMRLVNESDKTTVRVSPFQTQVDQFEGWILENAISCGDSSMVALDLEVG